MEREKFRLTLRVSSAAGDTATVFARKHRFRVGPPVHYDVEYGEITALEYALGALGGELVNGLRQLAKQRRIELDHVEAVVNGELNDPLAQAGVIGATGHAGLEHVSVQVYASALSDEEAVRGLWDELLRRSPLVRTLKDAVRLELTLKVT